MRLIDTMSDEQLEVLKLKNMLPNNQPERTGSAPPTTQMQTSIENNILTIKIPLETPTLSGSGKNLVVASTHGIVMTSSLVNGKPVKIGLNAFIPAK